MCYQVVCIFQKESSLNFESLDKVSAHFSVCLYCFGFDTGSLYEALDVLELTM